MGNHNGRDEMSLFDALGQRKYLIAGEASRFLAAALQADRQSRLFAQLLYHSGCRISEALATTPRLLDAEDQRVVFRTLKRRRRVYRAVPIPARLMRELVALARDLDPDARLFPWCRQTAWRRIHAIMYAAHIEGPQATARGLRHRFGVHAIGSKVPEGTLQRWIGHARMRNTHIYTFAVGDEELALAQRMWRPDA